VILSFVGLRHEFPPPAGTVMKFYPLNFIPTAKKDTKI
jgi:hypothetical protein